MFVLKYLIEAFTYFWKLAEPSLAREKRDLLKKFFKDIGHESVIVNNRYDQGYSNYNRRPEVHHYHYDNYPRFERQPYYPPRYGGDYYGGNYYNNYGGYGDYNGVPPQSGPIRVKPQASGHNAVDRGQGAAAVNNIAIIHARKGQSGNNELDSPIVDMERFGPEGF